MPAQTGSLCFDAVAEPKWDVPVAMIGGLPIAVIDRARSAAHDGRYRARPAQHRAAPAGLHVRQRSSALDVRPRRADPRSLSRRRSHPCRRHAAGLCIAPVRQRAAAGARRDDRPVPRHRDCRAAARSQYLSARRDQGGRRSGGAPYPGALSDLKIAGYNSGYLRRDGDEERIIADINHAQPDILWLGLGAPAEQSFAARNRDKLHGVGLIKTSGGLFDFVSGRNTRAPAWMQRLGLEWAYRIYLEPRRLAGRYLMTNPHAIFLLLTRTGRSANAPLTRSVSAP